MQNAVSCEIYSNISPSAIEEGVFSSKRKQTGFLKDFLHKDFTYSPHILFCLNKVAEFLFCFVSESLIS